MLLSNFPAAGPSDLSDFESISIGNSPSGWISEILVQNGATLSQSGRLSSDRDGKWNFEKLCASNRNCTLQLLLENLMVFWYFWRPFGHFSNGPQWDSISLRKKPSRWKVEFYGFCIFQIGGFDAVILSPERRFWKTQKWFRVHFFRTCTAMSVKNEILFHTLRPKRKLYMFLKQKV